MQNKYYVDLELHNNEPEPTYRQYEMLFEPINSYTVDMSVAAYQDLATEFKIRLKELEHPIFINQYLFTTITPESDYIRYFFVKYKQNWKAHPLSMIVQDCINCTGLAGAVIYKLHCLTNYTPLHDLYFKSLNLNVDVCFQMYLKNLSQYNNFESVFTDPNFEDEATQYQLLEY
ncbi:hypothetical protein [Pseudomonas putida]|uniref:hypothetical protein n=1 Tax=Pseudomonas putida TaxID=303 RepID=UPI000A93C2C4|nr:hypothetical protein [Pseudomonas putida]